jgi:hypothetical protein
MGDNPFCDWPDCDNLFAHNHFWSSAPNGRTIEVIESIVDDPRAEVRDSETGEVIFPAVKGPLRVIHGGRPND